MRKRHAYGATDNIILDFRADGVHMMGDAFEAAKSPRFQVKVAGTGADRQGGDHQGRQFVFDTQPGGNTADFTYVDANPGSGRAGITCGSRRRTQPGVVEPDLGKLHGEVSGGVTWAID